MNTKAMISALLLMLLVCASTFGTRCEILCSLASGSGVHAHCAQAKASKSDDLADMATMSPAAMQHMEGSAGAAQENSGLEIRKSPLNGSRCPIDHSLMTGQRVSNPQTLPATLAASDFVSSPARANFSVPADRIRVLQVEAHRPSAVLRI